MHENVLSDVCIVLDVSHATTTSSPPGTSIIMSTVHTHTNCSTFCARTVNCSQVRYKTSYIGTNSFSIGNWTWRTSVSYEIRDRK